MRCFILNKYNIKCEKCGKINLFYSECDDVLDKDFIKKIICTCSECNFENELVLKFNYTSEEEIDENLATMKLYDCNYDY